MRTLSKTILVFALSGCGVALAKAPEPATAPAPTTTTVAPATTTTSTSTTTTVPPTTTTTQPALTFVPKCPEAVAVARRVGWPPELLERLDQITWRESRCDPLAWNRDDPGSGSRGLTQVNSAWCAKNRYNPHPAGYLGNFDVLAHCDDLFIPEVAMTASLHLCWYSIQRHGHCWHPWKL